MKIWISDWQQTQLGRLKHSFARQTCTVETSKLARYMDVDL